MVRFDAESPQESEFDPESTRGCNLKPNKPKNRFRKIVDFGTKCVFALIEALLSPISIRIKHRGASQVKDRALTIGKDPNVCLTISTPDGRKNYGK